MRKTLIRKRLVLCVLANFGIENVSFDTTAESLQSRFIMKTFYSLFLLILLGGTTAAQNVDEYFKYLGMTSEEVSETGLFTATTSSDWSSNYGVVLELRKVGDTQRVAVISIYPDSTSFDKIYTRRSWEGKPFGGSLPHSLEQEMNLKQANKVLKKQKEIEIHWAKKETSSLAYHWDVETPMDQIDYPRRIVKIKGQMGMQRGLRVTVNFAKEDGESITHLTLDANY
jgi:hypothetical protein